MSKVKILNRIIIQKHNKLQYHIPRKTVVVSDVFGYKVTDVLDFIDDLGLEDAILFAFEQDEEPMETPSHLTTTIFHHWMFRHWKILIPNKWVV